MTEMTMKEALALAILTIEECLGDPVRNDQYIQAIEMLRDGGPVVEHSQNFAGHKCRWCDTYHKSRDDGDQCIVCGRMLNKKCKWTEKWTEREKLQIVPEKSKPTCEEIE